jgi:hypothetical protein
LRNPVIAKRLHFTSQIVLAESSSGNPLPPPPPSSSFSMV